MAPCRAVVVPRIVPVPALGRGTLAGPLSLSSRDVRVDRLGTLPEASRGMRSLLPRRCVHAGTRHCLAPRKFARYNAPARRPHAAETIELGGWEKTSWSEPRYTSDLPENVMPNSLKM